MPSPVLPALEARRLSDSDGYVHVLSNDEESPNRTRKKRRKAVPEVNQRSQQIIKARNQILDSKPDPISVGISECADHVQRITDYISADIEDTDLSGLSDSPDLDDDSTCVERTYDTDDSLDGFLSDSSRESRPSESAPVAVRREFSLRRRARYQEKVHADVEKYAKNRIELWENPRLWYQTWLPNEPYPSTWLASREPSPQFLQYGPIAARNWRHERNHFVAREESVVRFLISTFLLKPVSRATTK